MLFKYSLTRTVIMKRSSLLSSFIFGLLICSLSLHASSIHECDDFMIEKSENNGPEDFAIGAHFRFSKGNDADKIPGINESALTLESGPSAVVGGCVNAITGDYFESNTDLVVIGPQPLIVQRTYCSAENKWHFQHMPLLEVGKSVGEHHVNAVYIDDSGSGLSFRAPLKRNAPKGSLKLTSTSFENLTNAGAGEICGRTNWGNSRIGFSQVGDHRLFDLRLGSGVQRTFECYKRKGKHHRLGIKEGKYHLTGEQNPNGNKLVFKYNDNDELIAVRAMNEAGVPISVLNRSKDDNLVEWFDEHTKVAYVFDDKTLVSVTPSHGVPTWYSSFSTDGKVTFQKKHHDDRFYNVEYELLAEGSEVNVKMRVSSLLAPVGIDARPITTFTFSYHKGKKHVEDPSTDVRNAAGDLVKYTYDRDNKFLKSISRYRKNDQFYCKDQFFWARGNAENFLTARVFEGDGKYYFARSLAYDSFGNITHDHLWGNITGRNAYPLIVNGSGPQSNGCEVHTKTFQSSQDGLNLPLREDNGRNCTWCTYYPNTNRLATRFTGFYQTIRKREFFAYDVNGVLVDEVWDDGTSPNKDDLSGVTERHHRKIIPRQQKPIGLPEVIEEYYYDFTTHSERLLNKTVNVHSSEGRIVQQHRYGSDGNIAYTLFWNYDRLGNVIEEVNALNEKITREYDSNGNKILEKGPRTECYKRFAYDYSNRLIAEREIWDSGECFITYHRYNILSQKIASVDHYGYETRYFYDELGRLIRTELPPYLNENQDLVHPAQQTQYDAMGLATAVWDANGRCTQKQYTVRGQPFWIQHPDGSIERKEYTMDGFLELEVARNGLVTLYTHDFLGRVIRTEKRDPQGNVLSTKSAEYSTFQLISETDEAGVVTYYNYDGTGRRISTSTADKVTTCAYDNLGRKVKESQGDIHTIREYDLLNRVIEERIEDSAGRLFKREYYSYDSSGNRIRLTSETQAGSATTLTTYNPHNEPITLTDALGNCTHYTHNNVAFHGLNLRQVTTTDPLGNREIKIYDPLNRLIQETTYNPMGDVIQSSRHVYDAVGQLLLTHADVWASQQILRTVTTQWEYDSMGNMTHCVEAKGTPEQKQTYLYYNSYGQKQRITKANGIVLNNEYDLLGRLISFKSSDGTVNYAYAYDAHDNPICVTDLLNGTKTLRCYDQHSRLTSETLDTGYTLQYVYDPQDRLTSLTLPDQSAASYVYDAHHLTAIQRLKNGVVSYSHQYVAYDLSENVVDVLLPGEAGTVSYQYDLLGRSTATVSEQWQETVPDQGYDAVGNLLQRQFTDANDTVDCAYSYDNLYQLTSETGAASQTYNNDSLYNRIAKDGQPYTVNSLNQLLQQTDSNYTYDANGNLIEIDQDDGKLLFSYDALDRLTAIQNGDGSDLVSYRYDSFHRRLSKCTSEVTTEYLYENDNEIGALVNGQITELRILGLGKGAEIGAAVALESDGTAYIPIHDPYGNVVTLLDLSGNVVETYRYTAFGEELYETTLNPWRYSSKRVDPETGFIYFGRRYYMPTIGRWLTPDPLGFADGPNLYTFVHNQPFAYVDPDGQFAFLIPLAVSLALSYCAPPAAVFLAECTGCVAAASFVTGLADGYNWSCPDTSYCVDPTSSWAKCAGVAIGGALSLMDVPRKGLTKAVTYAAASPIAAGMAVKAGSAVTHACSSYSRTAATQTTLKTAEVAERYVAKRGVQLSKQSSSNKISQLEGNISEWLGKEAKMIKNKTGDTVFLSKNGTKKVRFDFNHPAPHSNPHGHIEEFFNGKWNKSGPIYPTDVPHY